MKQVPIRRQFNNEKYIERDGVEKPFFDLLHICKKGKSPTLLYLGEPSIGKSWIARKLTTEIEQYVDHGDCYIYFDCCIKRTEIEALEYLRTALRTYTEKGKKSINEVRGAPNLLLFDIVLEKYKKIYHPTNLYKPPHKAYLDHYSEDITVLSECVEVLANVAAGLVGVKATHSIINKVLSNKKERKSTKELSNLFLYNDLINFDELDETGHRELLLLTLCESLTNYSKKNNGKRVVILLDEYNKSPYVHLLDERYGWLCQLIRKTTGLATAIFSTRPPKWAIESDTPPSEDFQEINGITLRKKEIPHLNSYGVKRLIRAEGITNSTLINHISSITKFPLIISSLCNWLHEYKSINKTYPNIDEIPSCISDTYDLIINNQQLEEDTLLVLYAIGDFNKDILHLIISNLGSSSNTTDIDQFLSSKSCKRNNVDSFQLSPILTTHLHDKLSKLNITTIKKIADCILLSLTKHDDNHLRNEKRIITIIHSIYDTHPDISINTTALLSFAVNIKDTCISLLNSYELYECKELIENWSILYNKYISQKLDTNSPSGNESLLTHIAITYIYLKIQEIKWIHSNPLHATSLIDDITSILDKRLSKTGELELHKKKLNFHKTIMTRLAPANTHQVDKLVIDNSKFKKELVFLLSQLIDTIEHVKNNKGTKTHEFEVFTADWASKISYEVRKSDNSEWAIKLYNKVTDIYTRILETDSSHETMISYCKHLLYIPKGNITDSNLKQALSILKSLSRDYPSNIEIKKLRVRGLIRIAFIAKNNSPDDESIIKIVSHAEDIIGLKKNETSQGGQLLKLYLRVRRKLSQLTDNKFHEDDNFYNTLSAHIDKVEQFHNDTFRSICNELLDLTKRKNIEIDRIIKIFLSHQHTPLSPEKKHIYSDTIYALRSLLPSYDWSMDNIDGLALFNTLHSNDNNESWIEDTTRTHLCDLKNEISRIKNGHLTNNFVDLLNSTTYSLRDISDRGITSAIYYLFDLVKFLCKSGRIKYNMHIVEKLIGISRRYGSSNLDLHESVLDYIINNEHDIFSKNLIESCCKQLNKLKYCTSEDHEIGFLYHLSFRYNETNPRNDEALLYLWEALSLSEERLPHNSHLKRMVRKRFSHRLWRRLFIYNCNIITKQTGKKLHTKKRYSASKQEAFVNSPSGTLLDNLADFLSSARPNYLISGCMVFAKPIKLYSDDNSVSCESNGMLFKSENDYIKVSAPYLAREFFSDLKHTPLRDEHNLYYTDDSTELSLDNWRLISIRKNNQEASMVGPKFIFKALRVLYPGITYKTDDDSNMKVGASNSWLVIRTQNNRMTKMLNGSGYTTKALEKLMGLRRFTLYPAPNPAMPNPAKSEIINFSKNSRSDLVLNITGDHVRVTVDAESLRGKQILRTWDSMFIKCFPTMTLFYLPTQLDGEILSIYEILDDDELFQHDDISPTTNIVDVDKFLECAI